MVVHEAITHIENGLVREPLQVCLPKAIKLAEVGPRKTPVAAFDADFGRPVHLANVPEAAGLLG